LASTIFVDGATPILAAWLNDVNNYVYGGIFPVNPIITGNLTVNGTSLFKSKVSITLSGLTQLTLASSALEVTGSVNNYLSQDIQNQSAGTAASTDFVATANNGTDTTNYVNFGINSSGWATGSWTINGADDGYLYASDGNLSVGTAGAKYLSFFTGGTLAANERARFFSTGNFAINSTTDNGARLQVTGASAANLLSLGTASNNLIAQVTDSGTSSILMAGANSSALSIGTSNTSIVNLVANNATVISLGTAGQINGGQQAGLRNRIINGDMRIDQRNNGAAQTLVAATQAYTVDRFYALATGANAQGQRVAATGADQFAYQITGAASVTALAFGQKIEATNIYDLASTTVTFSVKLANSLLTTVTWTAYNPTATDNWGARTQVATGSFTVNSTLTKYSTTIVLTSAVQGGLEIELTVGAQTSGTWTITEFQVEAGLVATVFERRPIGMELALCQRYCYSINAQSTNTFITTAYAAGTTTARGIIQFPVTMRATPTSFASFSAGQCSAQLGGSTFSGSANAYTSSNSSQNVAQYDVTIAGATIGQAGSLYFNTTSGFIQFFAEL
jgi:hypothetical protein